MSYPLCNIDIHRHNPPVDSTLPIANTTAIVTQDIAAMSPAASVPNVAVAIDPSSTGPDASPLSSPNATIPFGTSNSVPVEPQPSLPIDVPSYPVFPESHPPDTPTGSAHRIHGVIAGPGVVEGITGTSTILSVANIVAPSTPSSPALALSGALLTIPQSDFPTPTSPSTSAVILSLVTPQAAVISDPQAVSTIATSDTHDDAYDLTTPAKPCPQPDKASPPPPDVATKPVPSFCDVGPSSPGTVRLITATDSPERQAYPSP